jgi:hypothetical protein
MKNKTLFAIMSCTLAFAMLAPLTLAEEDQYLPDVENLTTEALPGAIKFTWDPVQGADKYTVYYGAQSISEDGANYENDVLLENVTEYIAQNLVFGTTYYFAVAADDSTGAYMGSYNYSEEVSAVPLEAVAVEPPEDLLTPAPFIPDNLPADELVEPVAVLDESTTIMDILSEDNMHAAAATAPESLPQSGPATAGLILISSLGAFVYRKFKK